MLRKIGLAGAVLTLAFLAASCTAAPLKDSMLLYVDGESLKSPYPGVNIQQSIRVVDGKFGKALLMERRTLNIVSNGDFASAVMDGWILSGAERVAVGGVENSACLSANDGAVVAIPLTNLVVNSPYAFSFYAKSQKVGSITVQFSAGGQVKQLGRFDVPSGDFSRFVTSFYPDTDAGTLRLIVSKGAFMDNVQLEQGVTYANTFSTPLKMRLCDWITVPTDGKYLDQKQGAVSCWVNVPWMEDKEFSDGGKTIFWAGADNKTALGTSIWTRSKKNKLDKGNMFLLIYGEQSPGITIGAGLNEVKPAAWHYVVFNWKYSNGQMTGEIFIDGTSVHVTKTGVFGEFRPVREIFIGYANGAYLDGKLDDFAIWSRPLTKEEVLSIYSSGKPLSALETK